MICSSDTQVCVCVCVGDFTEVAMRLPLKEQTRGFAAAASPRFSSGSSFLWIYCQFS